VRIPDQEALISYVDGVETLAIETRFKGEGSEFAWIVPTPSRPEVSAGTLGTFPSLRAAFAPRVRRLGQGVAAAICMLALLQVMLLDLLFWRRRATIVQWLALLAALIFGFGLFMPTLGHTRGIAGEVLTGVQVHERTVVGAYDVAVLSSADGGDLMRWLADNGFAAPQSVRPVVDQYVKDGWCFVASRVRRDGAGAPVMTPHPLVFKFAAKAPVYPMRLTAKGMEDRLGLDLYVFGAGDASAPGMRVVSTGPITHEDSHIRGRGESLEVTHRALAGLTAGAAHATKLSGSVSPDQMNQDMVLAIGAPTTKVDLVMSRGDAAAAAVMGAQAGAIVASIVLLIRHRKRIEGRARLGALRAMAVAAAVIGGGLFLWIPKAETVESRMAALGYSYLRNSAAAVLNDLDKTGRGEVKSLEEARERLRKELPAQIKDYGIDDTFTEGDGPGQYSLEEGDGWIWLRYIDMYGREKREEMVWLMDEAGKS
jgi:hypothetical protein